MVKEVWSTVFCREGCNHLSCVWQFPVMWSCHSPVKRSTSPRLESKRGPSVCFGQRNTAEGMLCWHQAQLLTGLLSCVPCLREHQFLKLPDSKNLTGWMASSTQWTWVWPSPGRQWRTGKPGMLQSMGSRSRTWLNHWIIKDSMRFVETPCGDSGWFKPDVQDHLPWGCHFEHWVQLSLPMTPVPTPLDYNFRNRPGWVQSTHSIRKDSDTLLLSH